MRFRNSAAEVFTFESTGVVLGEWQHMTLTYDGAMLHFYLNGVLSASLAATGNLESANESFWIGSLPFQTSPFHFMGQIDEVSLWSKALSVEEINCIYNNDINPESDNLVLYYKMNQGIAGGNNGGQTDLIDAAGNINGQLEGFALEGFSSNFVEGISNATDIQESICEGESIDVGGQTFSTAGVYSISVPGVDGCDSIINLTLLVESLTATVTATDNVLTASEENVMYQWVDCDDNFTAIAGATEQTFTPTENGNYAVVVIDGNCEEISDCVNVTGVGINDPSLLSKLNVFPNPASETVFIGFDGILKMKDLTLNTIMGQSVFEMAGLNDLQTAIDLGNLPVGVYSLDIIFENGERVVQRIVKN